MREAKLLKIGDFLDQACECARMLRIGGRMPCEAPHMDFIDDRPVQRLGRKYRLTPIITGIGYNPAQSVGWRDRLAAIPLFIANRKRPWIKYFPPGAIRSLYPPSVLRTQRQLLDENMPR